MKDSWDISTFTGIKFKFDDPEFNIIDIAHALSHQCRFVGHTNRFYSIAQHSLLVSELMSNDLKLTGLLHDATEAYLGDVSRPLKRYLPDYKLIEENLQIKLCSWANIIYPFSKAIHDADYILLVNEAQQLMADKGKDWYKKDIEVPYIEIKEYSMSEIKNMFIVEYYKLKEKLCV
jgi:hypothetical protein